MLCFYGLIILFFTNGVLSLKNKKLSRLPIGQFKASVIIPVRNEQTHIVRILEEMYQQDYPFELMEVILTDDFSEDETIILASGYLRDHPDFPLKIVSSGKTNKEIAGKKQAITRALDIANGEIVLCTDADTWHSTSWITTMVRGFYPVEIQMVLGPVVFNDGLNLLQKIQVVEFLGVMGTTAGSAEKGCPVMCNGANLGYRRSVFAEVGGYTGNLKYSSGDDQFLMSLVKKRFGKESVCFLYDTLAIVRTEAESTISGFLNQRIRWISKSPGYRDLAIIVVGAVTWLTVSLLFAGMITGIFIPIVFLINVFFLIMKMAVDYPMVRIMIRFTGKCDHQLYYVLAQFFQLLYVPLVSLIGLFVPYRWKGRKS